MDDSDLFSADPDGTREAIMKATYLALCEHGYAGITIEHIGDQFEKSKSLLYNYYDSKDDLLLDFLEFMLEEFKQTVPLEPDQDAPERLSLLLDEMFVESLTDNQRGITQALVELRAQAAHNEQYRVHFTRSDEFFQSQLADIIQAGVETGAFQDVDPDRVAVFLVALINGTMTQRVTTTNDDVGDVRATLQTYLTETLYTADSAE
jgi:AcrR family transcriptional regulator